MCIPLILFAVGLSISESSLRIDGFMIRVKYVSLFLIPPNPLLEKKGGKSLRALIWCFDNLISANKNGGESYVRTHSCPFLISLVLRVYVYFIMSISGIIILYSLFSKKEQHI